MSDNWYDTTSGEMVVINDSDVDTKDIQDALDQFPNPNADVQQARKILANWSQNIHSRRGGIFQRDAYVAPGKIFDQFDTAEKAVEEDDIVSGVYETTESLAFSQMHIDCQDEDEQDIWDQIYENLDLDARVREMWREIFQFSNLYYGVYWGKKDFKVRGVTDKGNAKRRSFNGLKVPLGITILDPRKVVPAGTFMFNKESLVYLASEGESDQFNRILSGGQGGDGLSVVDPIVSQLILKEVPMEFLGSRNYLNQLGVGNSSMTKLFLLNPQNVFRHTLTRPQYKAIASVRMRSIFDLLDAKHQLKEMDRAHLLGATNWILLIKKGSDAQPGTRNEIQSLSNYVQQSARIPVIVSDHRLEIEIITPKTDHTLQAEKYDILDSRIAQRLFQMFVNPGGGRKEDSMKLARVIAAGMENRRDGLKRSFEKNVLFPIRKMNETAFTSDPSLAFNPRHIALDFDMNLANFLMDLRDRGELSRETLLAEFSYSQEEEAWNRKIEKKKYDGIFETNVPFAGGRPTSLQQEGQAAPVPVTVQNPDGTPAATKPKPKAKPTKQDPKTAGRTQGGNRSGGGSGKPATNRGKTKPQQA